MALRDVVVPAPPEADYQFLVGRFIDAATLARANAIAKKWGVQPHEVLIANGWIKADDYYRALANACHLPFKSRLCQQDVAPAGRQTPRQCLTSGLLKERSRTRRYVLTPDHRLRPNQLRELIARLTPYGFSLATPRSVRESICRHFAPVFAHGAVEALAARHPERSARGQSPQWQWLSLTIA